MADPYIDNQETLAYGDFAAGQILALVADLDADFEATAKIAAARLTTATDLMRGALKKADELDPVTYKPAEGAPDLVATGREALRQVVSYAESRDTGPAIVKSLLAGERLSTVLKRRPVKLAAALTHALEAIVQHAAELPEHAKWTGKLTAARDALEALNTDVRKSRTERKDVTPEVAAARAGWFKAYGAAKLIVEGVLRYHDKTGLLSEVFDDLAEIHRAPGVTDEAAPAEGGEGKPA